MSRTPLEIVATAAEPPLRYRLHLIRRVDADGRIPRGWGVAWREFDIDQIVLMPIPFNVLVSWARAAWHWFMCRAALTSAWDAKMAAAVIRAKAQARQDGYTDGHRVGYARGKAVGAAEVWDGLAKSAEIGREIRRAKEQRP